jgi:hypothetical protein
MRTFYAHTWTGRSNDWPMIVIGKYPYVVLRLGYDDNACVYGVFAYFFGHTFSRWIKTKAQMCGAL